MLKQPVSQLLARQSDKVGFSELAKLGGAAAEKPSADEEAAGAGSKQKEAAASVSAAAEEEPVEAAAEGPGVQQQWSDFCSARLATLTGGQEEEVAEKGEEKQHGLGSSEVVRLFFSSNMKFERGGVVMKKLLLSHRSGCICLFRF